MLRGASLPLTAITWLKAVTYLTDSADNPTSQNLRNCAKIPNLISHFGQEVKTPQTDSEIICVKQRVVSGQPVLLTEPDQ